ncbi:MAG: methyltransferase domain-containing protein [Nanoarchaeota archaeon]
MIRGFDIIGKIAVINLPLSSQLSEAKKLASKIIKLKNIETVAVKNEKFKGRLRKASYRVIVGKKTLETVHKENGYSIKLNLSKVYFSPRLASDRLEIAGQVRKGERVLVMFAGVLPYALCIAKHSKASNIVAIEINRTAVKYALENLKINKVSNVKLMQGDVKRVAKQFARKKEKFDRIVMPRPQLKDLFLVEAFMLARKGCKMNFHDFVKENEIPLTRKKIEKEAKREGRKIKSFSLKKIGEIAPHKYRVRADFVLY